MAPHFYTFYFAVKFKKAPTRGPCCSFFRSSFFCRIPTRMIQCYWKFNRCTLVPPSLLCYFHPLFSLLFHFASPPYFFCPFCRRGKLRGLGMAFLFVWTLRLQISAILSNLFLVLVSLSPSPPLSFGGTDWVKGKEEEEEMGFWKGGGKRGGNYK